MLRSISRSCSLNVGSITRWSSVLINWSRIIYIPIMFTLIYRCSFLEVVTQLNWWGRWKNYLEWPKVMVARRSFLGIHHGYSVVWNLTISTKLIFGEVGIIGSLPLHSSAEHLYKYLHPSNLFLWCALEFTMCVCCAESFAMWISLRVMLFNERFILLCNCSGVVPVFC